MDEATLKKRLGSALRKRREGMGVSQDTFADTIGMHRAYYSAIERGERNVTLQTIKRVATGLNAKIADVMSDAGL